MNTEKNNGLLNIDKKDISRFLIISIVLTVISLPVFYTLLPLVKSDILQHIILIINGEKNGAWPPHFLYHIFISFITFGSQNMRILKGASILTLTLFVILRAIISYVILKNEIRSKNVALLLALALVFVMPIINWWKTSHIYLGQLAPNVWHNPTTIFVLPLTLILFYVAMKSMDTFKTKDFALVSILLIFNALAKPNYLLAFLPVFGLVFLYNFYKRYKASVISLKSGLVKLIILFVPVVIVFIIQYFMAYSKGNVYKASIVLAPLKVWHLYSKNIPGSILVSIAFPLVFTIAYIKDVLADKKTLLSWVVFIVALIQFIFFSEGGLRYTDANFIWGSFIALNLLFLNCTAILFKAKKSKKFYFVLTVFSLHLLTGLYYYVKLYNNIKYPYF